jgi:integrase
MLDTKGGLILIEVEPIKNKKHIEAMKKILKGGNIRNYCFFVLGINIGLRVSDLLNLKIKDVIEGNKVKEYITVKERKTSKIRVFSINKNAKQAIQDLVSTYKKLDPNSFLFKSRQGVNRPINRVQAWQILNDAADSIGLNQKIGTHSLKKTFGYWAYKQGIDITLLQKIFNHSAPVITLRYIGITQEDINEVYINLNL